MAGNRRVAFGRVNRRQQTIDTRPFIEEIQMLVEMARMEKEQDGKHWIVADLELRDDYVVGMIGFEDVEERLHFDYDANSWIKSESTLAHGASSKALVPFAIDTREHSRWTACAISPRIQPATFATGLAIAMNAAREALFFPTDWEVDIVTSRRTVEEWLIEHPEVRVFRRTVRLPNPGNDLSDDIEEMQELAARTKKEEFVAGYDRNLRLTEPDGSIKEAFIDKLDGIERGQLDVYFEARGPGLTYKFNSKRSFDHAFIPDYGSNWELGIEFVLDALREYSAARDQAAAG